MAMRVLHPYSSADSMFLPCRPSLVFIYILHGALMLLLPINECIRNDATFNEKIRVINYVRRGDLDRGSRQGKCNRWMIVVFVVVVFGATTERR